MSMTWITDPAAWQARIDEIGHYDFYQLPAFIAQEASLLHGKAQAFYYQKEGVEAILPLILRDVPGQEGKWQDALSPYGYPGLILTQDKGPANFEKVLTAYHQFAKEAGVVATFVRLHPLHNQILLPEQPGIQQTFRGKTYSINLREGKEVIRANYSSNHRRNLKKLRKLGYQVVFDAWEHLPAWQEIYVATMDRLGAGTYYKFDLAYFQNLEEQLNCRLVTVMGPEGDIACGGIFTYYADTIQYHLGGTAASHLAIAPSKLMFDAVMEASAEQAQWKSLHLGGGVGAKEDSLARFKKGFANREHWFRTLEMIHHKEVYQNLSAGKEDTGFFPLYRKP